MRFTLVPAALLLIGCTQPPAPGGVLVAADADVLATPDAVDDPGPLEDAPPSAGLVVRVIDAATGEPLAGATVLVDDGVPPRPAPRSTGADGIARFEGALDAPATVTATLAGYDARSVVSTRAASLTFALRPLYGCPATACEELPDASSSDAAPGDAGLEPPPPPPQPLGTFRGQAVWSYKGLTADAPRVRCGATTSSGVVDVGLGESFELTVPLGEYAVFCWGPVAAGGSVEAERFGLLRHLVIPEDGYVFEGVVEVDTPLPERVGVVVEDLDPADPDVALTVEVFLDLGAEGRVPVPTVAPRAGEHARVHVPLLEEDLYDADFTIEARVVVAGPSPVSAVLRDREIPGFASDRWLERTPDGWIGVATGIRRTWRGIARRAGGPLLVGDGGAILTRGPAGAWKVEQAPTEADLHAVDVHDGSQLAVAVGDGGTALVSFEPGLWDVTDSGVVGTLAAVRTTGPASALAVSGPTVIAFDGQAWSTAFVASAPLFGLWASGPDDVWAVGASGTVVRYDGADWNVEEGLTEGALLAVRADGQGGILAAGEGGVVLRRDPDTAAWTVEATPTERTLRALGEAGGQLVAVGDRGTVLRRDGGAWLDDGAPAHRSALLAVGGDPDEPLAVGDHTWVMGPFLGLDGGVEVRGGAVTLDDEPDADVVLLRVFGAGPCGSCAPGVADRLNNDWKLVARPPLPEVALPDLFASGAPVGMTPGTKTLMIFRGRADWAFDIDVQPPPWEALYSVMDNVTAHEVTVELGGP